MITGLKFTVTCPACEVPLRLINQANNGGVRLIGILVCDTHGEFMVTVLLSRAGTHNANRGRFPRAGRPKVSAA